MPEFVGYLLLFLAVGVGFIFIHLLAGKLIRPAKPDAEKMTIYECGEPTIGSAWVQFDLRFYVIALLFVIFDVEVAFFFPWAVVFGKMADLANPTISEQQRVALTVGDDSVPAHERVQPLVPAYPETKAARDEFKDTLTKDGKNKSELIAQNREAANKLGWIALLDILVFFGVLLVGFAYLWRRGDLTWVRSVAAEEPALAPNPVAAAETKALVGVGQN